MDYENRCTSIAVSIAAFVLIVGALRTATAQYAQPPSSNWFAESYDQPSLLRFPPPPPASPGSFPGFVLASSGPSSTYLAQQAPGAPPPQIPSAAWANPAPGAVEYAPSCDCGAASCDVCCHRGSIYASFSFVWIQPHFEDGTATYVDPPPNDNLNIPFAYDYTLAPRVELGYCSAHGLGIQARLWQLDYSTPSFSYLVPAGIGPAIAEVQWSDTSLYRTAIASAGETLTAAHDLQLDVVDLEVTRKLAWGYTGGLVGFGLQYVDMQQRYEAIASTAAGVVNESVLNRHRFSGYGPCLSLVLNHSFGASGLGVYGGLRGAVLFGNADQEIVEVKLAGGQVSQDRLQTSQTMAIGEIQLGLEYAHRLHRGVSLFVRGGYEGQLWFDAGGPTHVSGDLGLEGLLFSIGVAR